MITVKSTLWKIKDQCEQLLWKDLHDRAVSVRGELVKCPELLIMIDEDNFGNITLLTRFGIRYATKSVFIAKAAQVENTENVFGFVKIEE